jgi:thymidylate kinase
MLLCLLIVLFVIGLLFCVFFYCYVSDCIMRIKRTKIHSVVNPKISKIHSKNVILTKDDFVKMPMTACIQGARGSGKTVACVQWVRHMEQEGYITKTYLISPTAETNPIFKNLRTLDEDDVCSDPAQFQHALNEVLVSVKEDMKEYKQYIYYKKIMEKHSRGSPLSITEEALMERLQLAHLPEVKKPQELLILDDVQGTDVFSSKRNDLMVHITIKHRHIPLSVIFLVQTFHGLPRPIRLNCTIYIVFSTSDEKQLEQIYQHFGNLVPREQFLEMYKYATSKPHGFLMIDTDPKKAEYRFRSGFNELLSIET